MPTVDLSPENPCGQPIVGSPWKTHVHIGANRLHGLCDVKKGGGACRVLYMVISSTQLRLGVPTRPLLKPPFARGS